MKMKYFLYGFSLMISLLACNGGDANLSATAVGEKVAADGYISEEVPGTGVQRVYKKDEAGNIIEDGFLKDSLKHGVWLTYEKTFLFPKTLANFENGIANGIYIEFNEKGQINIQAFYKNNKLHGSWAKFNYGRYETSAFYTDGILDGPYKEYMPQTGRLQKEINYKMGVQDGYFRYYNESGQINMEYLYKDGEKISGGIVDPPREVAPQ